MTAPWFDVDREGLRRLVQRRGPQSVAFELISNALDAGATEVKLSIVPGDKRARAALSVEDDSPEGFIDLSRSYTLFADVEKRKDPTKRGRFCLGEKLVLSLCESASITSTKGGVIFDAESGRRTTPKIRRARGTLFLAVLKMTRDEIEETIEAARMIQPPPDAQIVVNGEIVLRRPTLLSFNAVLQTEVGDEEGLVHVTYRVALVHLYTPRADEKAWLFEMGIPVCELPGDKWHVDVQQKVPLPMSRDGLRPSYLRVLRAEVLNAASDLLDAEDASEPWVQEASSDLRSTPAAVAAVVKLRFGDKVASHDPTDPEASKRVVADGYRVVYGSELTKGQWEKAREAGVVTPASRIAPSFKAFSDGGAPLNLLEDEWVLEARCFCKGIARAVLPIDDLTVLAADELNWRAIAVWKNGDPPTLYLNRALCPYFAGPEFDLLKALEVLIHEMAHHYAHDHLSSAYHDATCRVGAEVVALALWRPELFKRGGV